MYQDYFSLKEKPFSITPDPVYLFLSERHSEALAHLLYGVTDSGGFIQLTGEVGTGKTTTIRSLLEKLPENVDVALVLNPRLTVNEFLHTICDELRISVEKGSSNKDCIDELNKFLLDAYGNDRRVVLLIDEAQNLSVEVLEQIRLLTNLETSKDKLLQIILVGQPELQTLLQRQDLRQLSQRITARYHLRPLNEKESHDYLSHRVIIAGGKPDLIKPAAKAVIYKAAKGIPRLMNVIADRALLGAYSQEKPTVNKAIALQAVNEVVGVGAESNLIKTNKPRGWLALPFFAAFGALLWFAWGSLESNELSQPIKQVSANQNLAPQALIPTQTAKSETLIDSIKQPVITNDPKQDAITQESTQQAIKQAEVKTEKEAVKTHEDKASVSSAQSISLSELLVSNIQFTTSEHAFNQLRKAWSKPVFTEYANACKRIVTESLRCYYFNNNWDMVTKLDRPTILEIKDTQEQIHQIALISSDESTATLSINEKRYVVLLDELVDAWTGNSLLFWKLPSPEAKKRIEFGDSSDRVIELKEQLNRLNIEPRTSNDNPNFGQITQRQVINFQKQNGLEADGIVGVKTFIVLNNLLGADTVPRLSK